MNLKNKKSIITLCIVIVLVITVVFSIKAIKKYKKLRKEEIRKEEIRKNEAEELIQIKFDKAIEESAKIPASNWEEKIQSMQIKDKYRVVMVTTEGGENNYAEYFKYVAENRGWEVKKYLYKINSDQEFLEFDPDFVLFTAYAGRNWSSDIYSHRSRKYLLNLCPLEQVRDDNWIEKDPDVYSKSIDFIRPFHAIMSIPKDMGYLEKISNKAGKYFYGIGIIPAAPALINITAEPKTLMWSSMGWGFRYEKEEYKHFMQLLTENIPMKIYGKFLNLTYLPPKIYDGFIPSNGVEYITAIRKNGIFFLTHNIFHLKTGVPSLRIFEAVAANAVVISDKHKFAVENFGDSFLYYDHDAPAATMYSQVKAHMDWIKANPEKAKLMAARAHQIFLEKFTLDKDLDRIAKLHEYVLQQERKMNLSYPLEY